MTTTEDRETKSMEQCAREFRDELEGELDRIERVRELAVRADHRFGLDEELERLEEEFRERPYGVGTEIIVNVELYGGGPAGGVEFTCQRARYGLEFVSARVWHNDWFQSRGWANLSDDVAERMWGAWGLESLTMEDE